MMDTMSYLIIVLGKCGRLWLIFFFLTICCVESIRPLFLSSTGLSLHQIISEFDKLFWSLAE